MLCYFLRIVFSSTSEFEIKRFSAFAIWQLTPNIQKKKALAHLSMHQNPPLSCSIATLDY